MARTPCVEYTGTKQSRGYGVLYTGGTCVLAHRLAYCQHNGCTLESIAGKVVRHTCDNPPCINGEHLVIGTQANNMEDKVRRLRQHRHEQHPASKLTMEQARAIRTSSASQRALAKQYGVSRMTISRVIDGVTWKEDHE